MNREQKEPRGVIFILISPDKKVLLQQRDQRDSRFPGMWCFPGGACEEGEGYIQAVMREAMEEFEADLNAGECFLIMRRLNDRNAVYACPLRSTAGLSLHEGADMQWVGIEQAERIELGFHQSDILPVLREFLHGGSTHSSTIDGRS